MKEVNLYTEKKHNSKIKIDAYILKPRFLKNFI